MYKTSSFTSCKCPNYMYMEPYCIVNWFRTITANIAPVLKYIFNILFMDNEVTCTSQEQCRVGSYGPGPGYGPSRRLAVWPWVAYALLLGLRSLISNTKRKDYPISKSPSAFLSFYLTVTWLFSLRSRMVEKDQIAYRAVSILKR